MLGGLILLIVGWVLGMNSSKIRSKLADILEEFGITRDDD